MNDEQRRKPADRRARHGIALGVPTDLFPNHHHDTNRTRLSIMNTPTAQTPAAPSAEDQAQIGAIAKILGLDATDLPALAAACQELLGPPAIAELAARRQLTASELSAVRATPGCSARAYLATKRARGAR